MEHNAWDHALTVTGGGAGLVGHAGAILLRKAADQAGLTAGLSAALQKAGTLPLFDRGVALVSMAVAIAVGAMGLSDIAVLARLGLVNSEARTGTARRRPERAPPRVTPAQTHPVAAQPRASAG